MPEVISIGETMTLFAPAASGPLRYVHQFSKHIAGAESNTCIGLVRLGHSAGWVSRLGDDEFGRYILSVVRGEGVDTSRVLWDAEAPTGVFFKERVEGGETRVYYYRAGSAASRMKPEDLDEEYLRSARILHVTGITPALSESCRRTIFRAVELAKEAGVQVSFDPNLRLKLWSLAEARPVMKRLMQMADIVLPGWDEIHLLLEPASREAAVEQLLEWGAGTVALKVGAEGAIVGWSGGIQPVPGFPVARVVDPVGAGDAFAAGFLAGLLEGLTPPEAARLGNAAGAMATQVVGDIEGFPERRDLERFMGRGPQVADR